MICNICFDLLNNEEYSLIIHKNENYKSAKKRGHYFHNNCLNKLNNYKCPYDRDDIFILKKQKKIKYIDIQEILKYNDYSLLNLNNSNLLIKKNILDFNINSLDLYGRTLLYYACNTCNYKIVKKLLQLNADITINNYDNFTILMCISSNGNIKILNLLLNHPDIKKIINNIDNQYKKAFEYSIIKKNIKISNLIFKALINFNLYNKYYIDNIYKKYNLSKNIINVIEKIE